MKTILTFPTKDGHTRAIFHNMFKNDGEVMDVTSVNAIVGHMRGEDGANFHQTLGMVKQFITGYRHKNAGESYDTGILICPSCTRRDFMPFWEFVDFGFRNDNNDWTSTVKPMKDRYSVGGHLQVFGYHIVSRVVCNHATTCLDCKPPSQDIILLAEPLVVAVPTWFKLVAAMSFHIIP